METPKNGKLAGNFDPIWLTDFEEIRIIGAYAFLIRQLIRLNRDPKTYLSNTTSTFINELTGFDFKTIKKSIALLIKLGLLVQKSYHLYEVPDFKKTITLSDKSQTTLGNIPNHFRTPSQTTLGHLPNQFGKVSQTPIYNTETEKTEFKSFVSDISKSLQAKDISEDLIRYYKKEFPFDNREDLKTGLTKGGFNESEISKIFERVYPQQYTGKAGV